MKFRVVPARELSPELCESWLAVLRDEPSLDSPYLHPEYTAALASVRDDLELVILEEAGSPVGFLPFQRDRRARARPIGGRLTDLQGAIVSGDCSWEPRDLLRGCDLSALDFDRLLGSQRALRPWGFVEGESPYLDLSGGFERYAAERRRLGNTLRHTQRKARRLARDVGALRFESHTPRREVFEALLAWKSQQRRRTGTFDVLELGWVVAALDRIRTTRCEGFSGRLSALYAGDSLVAAHLGMASDRALHFWFPAYDPAYAAHSPGAILLLEIARAAAEEGIRRIDLGPGRERYKESFRSGGLPIWEGSVDPSAVNRALLRAWCRARSWSRDSPLAGPLKACQRALRRLRPPEAAL